MLISKKFVIIIKLIILFEIKIYLKINLISVLVFLVFFHLPYFSRFFLGPFYIFLSSWIAGEEVDKKSLRLALSLWIFDEIVFLVSPGVTTANMGKKIPNLSGILAPVFICFHHYLGFELYSLSSTWIVYLSFSPCLPFPLSILF